jgi:NAD(P)-dependent dehydrogenase (short-subunit alcohol dehydrogenase family)
METASTALITGGTSGIGRAAANKLAQFGIHVLVVGRNAERGNKTVAQYAGQYSKRILSLPIFEMPRVRVKWRGERSS